MIYYREISQYLDDDDGGDDIWTIVITAGDDRSPVNINNCLLYTSDAADE